MYQVWVCTSLHTGSKVGKFYYYFVLRHITLYIRDTRETRHTTHAFYALAGCEVDEPMARRRIQRLIGRS